MSIITDTAKAAAEKYCEGCAAKCKHCGYRHYKMIPFITTEFEKAMETYFSEIIFSESYVDQVCGNIFRDLTGHKFESKEKPNTSGEAK